MRIAILEDDPSQLELVQTTIGRLGHHIHTFTSGKQLINELRRESYDLLILDWNVPDIAGIDVVKWVRENIENRVPVIFSTNRTSESDILNAFNCGADDYVIKPISPPQLVARVQALLLRAYPASEQPRDQTICGYHFKVHTQIIEYKNQSIQLTQKEFDLALLFFQNLSRPLSRAYITESIWGRNVDIPSRTMDTHVSRIRNKLDLKPENGFKLTPVYGYGYRLEHISGF